MNGLRGKNIFISASGNKKTLLALKLASETGSLMVGADEDAAKWLADIAKQYGFNIIPPVSIQKLSHPETCKGQKFIFDNIDLCICSLLGIEINSLTGATIIAEEKNVHPGVGDSIE